MHLRITCDKEEDATTAAPDADADAVGGIRTRAQAKEAAAAASKADGSVVHNEELYWGVHYDRADLVALVLAAAIGAWQVFTKHWIATNLMGLSFAINGVSMLSLNTFWIGCCLLCGLFVYDVFWVFGTDVMVTVASSFDAPIKLVFPKDLIENGLAANKHALLGLGDIVIPGIFIALLLRFDMSRIRNKQGGKGMPVYFYASYVAYIAGLTTTVWVMHTFKAAQPALLYLVPFCILTPLLLSVLRGETGQLLSYSDDEATKQRINGENAKAK